ncbi:ABC transporter ATP-binding protein [Chloroflexus sp.]|uniref:energy-coupling factor ABC transporter ATP-binding protein n=1 Tax=Chloroflexus sp. TaxID=1904827 RepID=UPI002ADE2F05|nr:ABC transporter ATP-binding protein [Chloroflexus sp.]
MIELTQLWYRYPDHTPALRGISLTVAAGEKVALLGVNGAGKSTLLLHLNGTLHPERGTVVVNGIPVTQQTVRQVRAMVGLVFQNPDDQLFSATVGDDVAFGPQYMGLPPAEVTQRVHQALAAVGMQGVEQRPPHRLSLGQRKRVALATVLAMRPAILALDEPSAGLDPRARRDLIDLLHTLPQTMIIATHDLALAADLAPRAIVMADGQIVADEATTTLLADQQRLYEFGLR